MNTEQQKKIENARTRTLEPLLYNLRQILREEMKEEIRPIVKDLIREEMNAFIEIKIRDIVKAEITRILRSPFQKLVSEMENLRDGIYQSVSICDQNIKAIHQRLMDLESTVGNLKPQEKILEKLLTIFSEYSSQHPRDP